VWPLTSKGTKGMSKCKDDGLWHPGDYDDEPRSNGNFGLDVQQQEAKKAAEEREILEQTADRINDAVLNAFRHAAAEAAERKRAGKYLSPTPPVPDADR
jgi:hypothetical protein